jgi:hypothetical protein
MLTPMLNYKEDHEIVKSNNEKVDIHLENIK